MAAAERAACTKSWREAARFARQKFKRLRASRASVARKNFWILHWGKLVFVGPNWAFQKLSLVPSRRARRDDSESPNESF